MQCTDLISTPWAIDKSILREIHNLSRIDTRWEATDRIATFVPQPFQVLEGVAVIPVNGVILKALNAWPGSTDVTSSSQIQCNLISALDDPEIHSILLWIDSPGGTVDGSHQLARTIYNGRNIKPIVALADGRMCSAAYWIGSAAEKAFVSCNTTEVGGIGVVTMHRDISAQESKLGVKTTEITAGQYKRIASQHLPLSEQGKAMLQSQVDYIYSVFVQEVAAFRGVSADVVFTRMADGRVFLGNQAVSNGLVDGISTRAELIKKMNRDRGSWKPMLAPPNTAWAQWSTSPYFKAHFSSFEAFVHAGGIAGFYGPNGPIYTQAKIREKNDAAAASKASDLKSRWDSNILVRNLYGTFEAFQKATEATEAAISTGRLRK